MLSYKGGNMNKKDEILNAEEEEKISEEEIFFEEEPIAIIKSQPIKGIPALVINIMGGDFILTCNGNGIRMPIPKEYKDKKIGDTIYL